MAKPAVSSINPGDAMAADLPYKAAVKAKPIENDDICWHGVCVYGNFDMGLSYIQHGAPLNSPAGRFTSPSSIAVDRGNGDRAP